MTTVRRATVLSFDPATWTAQVLIEGADMEAKMPVGQWVPAGMMVADAEVAVICFDPTNLDDGAVLGAYGGLGAQNLATTDNPTFAGLQVGASGISTSANINATGAFKIAGTNVVSARKTGWTAWTGTPTRTSKATSTATLVNVAEAVKALIDDLISHGLIGA